MRPLWGATCHLVELIASYKTLLVAHAAWRPTFAPNASSLRVPIFLFTLLSMQFYWSTPMLTGLGILAVLMFIAFSAARGSQR